MPHSIAEPRLSTPRLLPVASFSTSAFETDVRYEVWRQLMGTAHDIEADPSGFTAEVRSVHLDRMVLHTMDAAPQQVRRTAQRIRRDGLEHFVLHLSDIDGAAETADSSVALKAGRVSLNDLTRPSHRAAMPERGSVILSLSRDLIAEALGNINGLHGLVLDNGPGLLLASHMRALSACADRISADAAPSIARATAHLLAASVSDRPGQPRRAEWDGIALLRAKRFIDEHLGMGDLAPDQIAKAAAVSRSSLFRMFKPFGGVAAFVQKRRLDRVKACLINPAEARPLSALAYAHGFTSLSQFNRAFRDRFDCTPSNMREGRLLLLEPGDRPGTSSAFGSWIRDLG